MLNYDCAMGEIQSSCEDLLTACRRVIAIDRKECHLLSQLTGNINHLRSQLAANRRRPVCRLATGISSLVDRFGRSKKSR